MPPLVFFVINWEDVTCNGALAARERVWTNINPEVSGLTSRNLPDACSVGYVGVRGLLLRSGPTGP